MNSYNKTYLDQISQEKGFVRDNLEKVIRLAEILRYINQSPLLQKSLVLKGGTAINLTVFRMPRLSVDIDLDFVQNCNREEMIDTRQKINNELKAYMSNEGYSIKSGSKSPHALDSWVFGYTNAGGNPDNIKIEINYSDRQHVLPIEEQGLEHIKRLSYAQVRAHLMPVLSRKEKFDLNTIKSEVMSFLDEFLVFSENEYKFIEHFNRREYRPDILFGEGEISKRIASHPMALWKCRPKEQ